MKKADFWFIVIALLVFLALLIIIMNISGIFPTPNAQELAKTVISK
jgi:hypothetical protein